MVVGASHGGITVGEVESVHKDEVGLLAQPTLRAHLGSTPALVSIPWHQRMGL